jgi:hypothetical protein
MRGAAGLGRPYAQKTHKQQESPPGMRRADALAWHRQVHVSYRTCVAVVCGLDPAFCLALSSRP